MQRNPNDSAGADPTPAVLSLPDRPAAALVGFGYYTPAILDLCAEAGVPVAFAVDDREGADGDPFGGAHALRVRGLPILSPAEFGERARRTPGLTLVGGRIECPPDTPADADPFARALAWVRRVAGGGLLHPAALLERVPAVRCPGRYAVLGYPGSGNILTHTLIDHLFGRAAEPAPAVWSQRAALAEHYFHSTAARVRATLAPLGPAAFNYYEQEFGRTNMYADFGGGRVAVVTGVPSLRHHGIRAYGGHVQPVPAAVEFFNAAGVPCVIAARHPCETLLSFANKIGRPVRAILDRPTFLPKTVGIMADWYGHVLANRDRLIVSRYEDLADRRADRLRELAERLGLSLSADEATDVFDRYLNRNLPESVPTHFHRGGNDKWQREFTRDHLRTIRQGIPDAVFTAFGYEVPTDAHLLPADGTAPAPSDIRSPTPTDELLLGESRYRRLPGPFDISVTASDPELLDAMAAAMDDSDLRALLAAGGIPVDRPICIPPAAA